MGLLISLLVVFVTFASILRRIYHNPTLVTARNNRYFFYMALFVFLAVVFGLIGEETGNNWIFYGASLSTELMNYFGLCWVRLNLFSKNVNEDEAGLIVRPFAFVLLLLTNLVELTAFELAGKEAFNTLSMANHREASQNVWLVVALITTLVYALGVTLLILTECLRGLRKSGKFSFKYRCVTLALVATTGTGYFGSDLGRYIIFLFNEDQAVLETGLALRNLIGLGAFIVVSILIFFDTKFFKWMEKYYERSLIKGVYKLQAFYQYTTEKFPAEFRFSPYPAVGTKAPSWVLNEVLDGLADLRNYFWQAYTRRQMLTKGVGLPVNKPVTLEQEAVVWANALKDPKKTNELTLSMNYSVDVPEQQINSNEAKHYVQYYVKLSREVSKLLGVDFDEKDIERKKNEAA